ncbi:MAG: LacI family DNA-binding transcriptional regulator [Pseudomonadota bacterium]
MPTIRDVAKHAGVSVGTVSRVLSENETVQPDYRERVRAAIRALGYKPNFAARALRTNKVDVIGLLLPDITNPFFAQLAKSVEMEAAAHGHFVILANSHDDPEIERRQISALLDRSPRGLIVAAASDSEAAEVEADVPILSIDRRLGTHPLASVDNRGGAAMVADHLYELGHRAIAYIAGPQTTEVGRIRKYGFVDRMSALSTVAAPIEVEVYEGKFCFESGEEIAKAVLTGLSPPTAIASANDQIAIGALRAARDLGMDVPGEVSVAGFDDIELSSLVVPRLTTISQPTAALAKAAISQIFDHPDEPQDAILPGVLVKRGSTATAPSPALAPTLASN